MVFGYLCIGFGMFLTATAAFMYADGCDAFELDKNNKEAKQLLVNSVVAGAAAMVCMILGIKRIEKKAEKKPLRSYATIAVQRGTDDMNTATALCPIGMGMGYTATAKDTNGNVYDLFDLFLASKQKQLQFGEDYERAYKLSRLNKKEETVDEA